MRREKNNESREEEIDWKSTFRLNSRQEASNPDIFHEQYLVLDSKDEYKKKIQKRKLDLHILDSFSIRFSQYRPKNPIRNNLRKRMRKKNEQRMEEESLIGWKINLFKIHEILDIDIFHAHTNLNDSLLIAQKQRTIQEEEE